MGLDVIDRFEGSSSFVVAASQPQGGVVDLPTAVEIERVPVSDPQQVRV
jgi:hypothetical protein